MAIVKSEINQKTLDHEVSLSGVGLHTGKNVKLTFKPAKVNSGFSFKRTDLEGEPTISADANFVTDTERGTKLEKNGVVIQTCEHVYMFSSFEHAGQSKSVFAQTRSEVSAFYTVLLLS